MVRGPEHKLQEFYAACRAGTSVIVLSQPLTDARQHFGLLTRVELLEFIGNDGLEKMTFVNCKEWEKSHKPGRFVDAYQFHSGTTPGYIAFCFCTEVSKWFIKSFHPETSPTTFVHRPLGVLAELAEKLKR
jgi:hypothetical protein